MSILIDLEGTLCCSNHRAHLRGVDWDAFNEAAMDDVPNRDVVWFLERLPSVIVRILITNQQNYLLVDRWLGQNGLRHLIDEVLLRRQEDQFLPEPEFKINALEARFGSRSSVLENIELVLDNRDATIDALRDYGLNVWQVR